MERAKTRRKLAFHPPASMLFVQKAVPTHLTSSHRQHLEWIAAQPRCSGDVMDAWRSTCPKLTIWEDVLDAGFVQIDRNGDMRSAAVTLTPAGRSVLNTANA